MSAESVGEHSKDRRGTVELSSSFFGIRKSDYKNHVILNFCAVMINANFTRMYRCITYMRPPAEGEN